jgi:hypothetical protein
MNPTGFSGGMAAGFEGLNPQSESLADGIGGSYGVMSYKGKTWTLRYRGHQYPILRPDDGTPAAYLDVVILDQARLKSKSYYAAYNPQSSEGARPICSSINGLEPDGDVQQKQSETCALCPRNEWRPGANGKKTKECTDYKRLSVLLHPQMTQRILGEALMEPVFLRIPPASLQNLAAMGEQMAAQGYHYASYITRITFDPAEPHPKMQFMALKGLTPDVAPTIMKLRNDPLTKRIIEGDMRSPLALTAPQGQTISLPSAAVSAPVATQPITHAPVGAVARSDAPPPGDFGFGGAAPQAAPQPQQTSSSAFAPTTMNGGTPSQADFSTPDTGAPDESDDALDARIAKLVAPK